MDEGQPVEGHHQPSTVILTSRTPAETVRDLRSTLPWWDAGGATVVTPGPLAARAVGAPHLSLLDVARTVVAARGQRFASALTRRTALRSAVAEAWGTRDPAGVARSVEATVRELLRAGAGVGSAGAAGSVPRRDSALDDHPRLVGLLALVAVYRRTLAADGLIDRAEALWLAAGSGVGAGQSGASDAAADQRGVPEPRLLVSGYSWLGADEVEFLASRAAHGSVVILPGGAAHRRAPSGEPRSMTPVDDTPNGLAAAALARRGWSVLTDEHAGDRTPAPEPPAVRLDVASAGPAGAALPPRLGGYRLQSMDAEVRFVLTTVKELLVAGVPAREIVLVAPTPRLYGPLVLDVGREYALPLLADYAVPLTATPFGYLVGTLAGVVAAGLPFEETARLLSHRLVPPMSAEAWVKARRRHPRGLGQWREVDQRAASLDWPRSATRSAYTDRLEATLDDLGALDLVADDARSDGHRALLFGSMAAYAGEDAAAAGSRGQAVAGASQDRQPVVSLTTYVGELLDHLELVTTSVGTAGRADGVALVDPSALAGASVSHVFVLGAAEGAIPGRLDGGPWLDFFERRAARAADLSVDDAGLASRREALSFDAVVRAAGSSLTLTVPESGERDDQLPSPYFATLGLVPRTPYESGPWDGGTKPPASLEELRRQLVNEGHRSEPTHDRVLAAARHALDVEVRRESGAAPDEYDGVVGEPYPTAARTFSATALLALGQCAFKWFAQYALGLREPLEADEELSPLVRGNLYHAALELASEAARKAGGISRDAVLAALPEAFALAERREAVHTANWPLHRGQHLATLTRVVRAESFLPEGTEVVATEWQFGAEDGRPARWRGFEVTGRIDRVDRRGGRLTLVDYKTSASKPLGVQDAAGEARVDLQLPIYLEAAAPLLDTPTTQQAAGTWPAAAGPSSAEAGSVPAAAEYYSVTKARVISSTSLGGDDTFDRHALQAFAERAHAALAHGSYPVAPDRSYKVCLHCAFDAVCRVGPRVERKRAGDG